MAVCQRDSSFSAADKKCEPYTDEQCDALYDGWKSKFDTTPQRCVVSLPVLSASPKYERVTTADYSGRNLSMSQPEATEKLRSILVPPFLRSMDNVLRDLQLVKSNLLKRIPSFQQVSAAKEATDTTEVISYTSLETAGALTIVFIVVTVFIWILIFLRECCHACCECGPYTDPETVRLRELKREARLLQKERGGGKIQGQNNMEFRGAFINPYPAGTPEAALFNAYASHVSHQSQQQNFASRQSYANNNNNYFTNSQQFYGPNNNNNRDARPHPRRSSRVEVLDEDEDESQQMADETRTFLENID
ncbi:hypothetical protein ADEAN_000847200 [Angomonas deanei]|uniref:Uncharacterized protein n=1 Tax=Angomonas deanei TaxID=59799 RepID=A0A7G2CM91_9TRYP|nr:hypothetical protein ADEAN_000847200 [Angomonas deanei]